MPSSATGRLTSSERKSETSMKEAQSTPPPASQRFSDMTRLKFCATGICVCYFYYGILQEKLFDGDQPLGSSFILLTQCLTNTLVALLWQGVQDMQIQSAAPTSEKALPHQRMILASICYVSAMGCSNEAIPYVSYPVAVLAKSCKLIPTMLVGQFIEKRLYSQQEWMAALLISLGIVLFHCSRLQQSPSSEEVASAKEGANYGMALLMVSLCMDGLLSSCQNLIKSCDPRRYIPPNAVESMFWINTYAALALVPVCMAGSQWVEGFRSLKDPQLAVNVLILNTTVAVGQIFIFLTLTWFTPVITTTITTTRKFFTILLSVVTFGHSFTAVQWLSIGLVFSGLYLVINVQRAKTKTKQA